MNAQTGIAIIAPAHEAPVDGALPRSKRALRVRLLLALLAIDIVTIFAAFALASAIWLGFAFDPAGIHTGAVLIPLYVVFASNRNIYSSEVLSRWRSTAVRAVGSLGGAALSVLFVSFYMHASATMSRGVFSLGFVIAAAGIVLSHFAMHRLSVRLFHGKPVLEVLIRDGVAAAAPDDVHVVDAAAAGIVPTLNDPRSLSRLGNLLRQVDRVVIACPPERREAWATMLKGSNTRGEIITPELGRLGALGAGLFEDDPTLLVAVGPLNLRQRLAKRALDTVASGGALLLLAPLLLLVALAIRLESPGPVLFVQQRMGRGNRLFRMYKFRSMHAARCDANGDQSTQRDDKRVTRVGKVIRATSLDELPQLLNVLKGDMSLVGPRPHALGSLAGDKLFWEVDERYWHRHAAKPGITGLAQVRGFRGATHLQSDLVDRLQSDLDYVNGWTIWRDASILLSTVRVMLHKNAY